MDERVINIHIPNPDAPIPLEAARLTGAARPEDIESIFLKTSVYVYEVPVRLWHWLNAAMISIVGRGEAIR